MTTDDWVRSSQQSVRIRSGCAAVGVGRCRSHPERPRGGPASPARTPSRDRHRVARFRKSRLLKTRCHPGGTDTFGTGGLLSGPPPTTSPVSDKGPFHDTSWECRVIREECHNDSTYRNALGKDGPHVGKIRGYKAPTRGLGPCRQLDLLIRFLGIGFPGSDAGFPAGLCPVCFKCAASCVCWPRWSSHVGPGDRRTDHVAAARLRSACSAGPRGRERSGGPSGAVLTRRGEIACGVMCGRVG